jgi:Fe-S-cluster containining protein
VAGPTRALAAIDARVAERVAAVRGVRPDWPCRRGCDGCCRALARPLELTAAEWERVDAAVGALAPADREAVAGRVEELLRRIAHGLEGGPVVCPYLDEAQGACRIYEARPVACRTYGFFVARDAPEHCSIIERDVAERGEKGIVWGNAASLAASVERDLGAAVSFEAHHGRAGVTGHAISPSE